MNDGYMGSGKVIKRAIEKHGINNFKKDILKTFDNSESMYAYEKEMVTEQFLSRDDVYNLRRGGYGGFDYINSNPEKYLTEKRLSTLMTQQERTERWKQKFNTDESFRESVKSNLKKATEISMRNNPNGTWYGKCHTDETKNKMSKSHSGKHEGNKNSQFGTCWITNGADNKKISKLEPIPIGWKPGRVLK